MLTQEKSLEAISFCPALPYGLCYSWDRLNAIDKIKIKTPNYSWKRTENTKSVIGYLTMYAKDDHLEIWNVRINAKYRGRGYGQKMIKEAVEMANGIEIVLYVKRCNDAAIHVYEKCGFVVADEISNSASDNVLIKMVYPGEKLTFENCPSGICGYWGDAKVIV